MIVYRIALRKRALDIHGTGAALYPGRWNKKGTPVLYAGESIEIALLENIVHAPPMFLPDLEILTIEIPDDSVSEIKESDLPANWFKYPAPSILAEIGEAWVAKGNTIALKVPSCIITTSFNYILNCNHKDYHKVKLLDHKQFRFDPRLSS
ncbi:MAG: RES family NAD+ phosphorylase [Bacteroidota bacterium]|nr:RES family NAD+ phosphorylase [Bacteroidota bacterium]